MGVKVTVVGGGSTYTPELVEGVVNRADRLPIDELALLDVDGAGVMLEDEAGDLRFVAASDDLVTSQVFVDSDDGTRVPMFLIHRADVGPRHGPAPTILYGYGGFGISLTPGFNVSRASILRLSPSVGDMATHRTMPPSICMATSQTIFRAEWSLPESPSPSATISIALRISGISSGSNLTSTMGPMICTMVP